MNEAVQAVLTNLQDTINEWRTRQEGMSFEEGTNLVFNGLQNVHDALETLALSSHNIQASVEQLSVGYVTRSEFNDMADRVNR
jgi:hypothetical protein